ncbi:MAG TPA: 3-deoxy-7-phosphoheptulonate synthase [Blastocatellia bacterium]|jgi:3-deoxy-7-phosphoheptulonate synthase|nr:3-deoxy-7-phosphoheptulonate synthase [Blastocatellia bacterium]
MIIAMKSNATEEQIEEVCESIRRYGYKPHLIRGEERVVIGAVGHGDNKDHLQNLRSVPGVADVVPILQPYKIVSRELKPQKTVVSIGDLEVGGDRFIVMAGPCSVETRDQLMETADAVKQAGAHLLRGGAYKPRTSPYDFQGLEVEGLKLLADARERTGLKIVTEVVTTEDTDIVAEYSDVLQVGARNMQNFALLKRLGQVKRPVLLKRGMSSTIKELLLSAEYIASHGNDQVILCERGIRTFETATRNTLDLAAVPLLNELSHLPVIVDPSHATGRRSLVKPMAKAAIAAGADGLIIEVHPRPQEAWSDGPQSLTPEMFAELMEELNRYVGLESRYIN